MQAGFAFLEAGSVRSKSTTTILLTNCLDSGTTHARVSARVRVPDGPGVVLA